MESNSWENALKRQQGVVGGGGSRSPSPGTTGNIAYAPGMMNASPSDAPTARQMQSSGQIRRQANLGPSVMPSSSGSPPSSGGAPAAGQPSGMTPEMASFMIRRIMQVLDRHIEQRGPQSGVLG